jgi:hypothetical protein
MAISVTCPHCSRAYSVKDRELGKTILCGGCEKEFVAGARQKPVKKPAPKGADRAGWASVILGALSLCAVLLGCTLGFSLLVSVPLALAGLVLGFFGSRQFKVAGLILNGLVLVLALGWVIFGFSARNELTPEQEEIRKLRQEMKTLP